MVCDFTNSRFETRRIVAAAISTAVARPWNDGGVNKNGIFQLAFGIGGQIVVPMYYAYVDHID